ncbi:hypothetical protein GKC29_04275 [Micromonospora sp. WMMC415]|uniref:SMI1/KNR4 family protein n=1 Tax=Micromonospora sp. WMMC415 TaxID=2675222 RepID=UPI0012B441C2|nr:SMI1/KNR4 family protein [Micromonospora sp. WMMC415]QGN46137.1 hypothetical protein GKC29_04275 [Micromonospora sp. WMMC415]
MDDLATLADLLQLPPMDEAYWRSSDWSAIETALGAELPSDYKFFVDTYGPGAINDHLLVCAPDASLGWTDLVDNNEVAQESCRIWFSGVDDEPFSRLERAWPLGDSSRWDGDHVPDWFQPGDNLISWGGTPNGDFLFWHVKPGVAPADHPVVLRERGPYFERFDGGFAMTLGGLLTGTIRSRYLSRWLRVPHSYGLAGRRDINGRHLE